MLFRSRPPSPSSARSRARAARPPGWLPGRLRGLRRSSWGRVDPSGAPSARPALSSPWEPDSSWRAADRGTVFRHCHRKVDRGWRIRLWPWPRELTRLMGLLGGGAVGVGMRSWRFLTSRGLAARKPVADARGLFRPSLVLAAPARGSLGGGEHEHSGVVVPVVFVLTKTTLSL